MAVTPLATPDDATAYGYAFPDNTAATWLARATIRVRREAGQPITTGESTVRLSVDGRDVELPAPPISAVTAVVAVANDGTTTDLTEGTQWWWTGGTTVTVHLPVGAWQVDVTYTHGFTVIPDELIELVCSIAYRLSTAPVGMEAGIRSVTIDDYSRTFAAEARLDAAVLLPGETAALGRIIGIPTTWVVQTR